MGIERAADIIAASLSGEEVALLSDFGRKKVTPPEEPSETFRSLRALRLIEGLAGGPKVAITQFGREVLAQTDPIDKRY